MIEKNNKGRIESKSPSRRKGMEAELKDVLEGVKVPQKKDYLDLKVGGQFVKDYLKKIEKELVKYNPGDDVSVSSPEGYSVSRQMLEFVAEILRKQGGWKVEVKFESSCMSESGYSYLIMK